MGIHVQGSFGAELASLAPEGDGGGPSTSLRYARDDKKLARDDKKLARDDNKLARDDKRMGVLVWGNALVTFYAGCAQAQPSEAAP